MKPRPTSTRPTGGWIRALLALCGSLLLVALIAEPSLASSASSATTTGSLATVANSGNIGDPVTAGEANLVSNGSGRGVCNTSKVTNGDLPVTRWSDGMSFHDRLHGYKPGDIAKSMQREGVVSMMFGIGNTAWSVTTGATEMAINFCVLDKVGGLVDNIAADIGRAILGSGLVALFVVISIVVYFWRIGRGQGGGTNTSALVQKALVLSLFGIMVVGATNSTGGGADHHPDAAYKPGLAAPGWFVTQIDQVVSASASSLASSVESKSIDGAETGPSGRAGLGCAPYVAAMKKIYRQKYGTGFGANASATVPLLLSSMWESSALEMWKEAQFGDQSVGTYRGVDYGYGDLMYCRMLESNVAAKRWPVSTYYDTSVSSVMAKTGSLDNETFGMKIRDSGNMRKVDGTNSVRWHTDGNNLAWRYSTSNKNRDRQWVGWAACSAPFKSGSGNDPGAALVHSNDPSDTDLRENCKNFFTDSGWDGGSGQGEFDWDESDDDISDTGTSANAEDFLLTLHGNRQAGGMVAGIIYMTSSAMIAAVFILFSMAILVAKVAALVMMLAIFLVLTVALLPNTSMSKVTDFLKQYVGLSLFAWGAQLIMSVIALVTAILINVGNQIVPGGPGGVMAVAWVGFAPVIAVFCLHFIFKKMRIPSPLKMSGGLAWGQMAASGAIGGAAGMGAGAWANRATNRAKRVAGERSKAALGNVTGRTRLNKMQPSGSAGSDTSTGAATSKTGSSTGTKTRSSNGATAAAAGAAAGAAATTAARRGSNGQGPGEGTAGGTGGTPGTGGSGGPGTKGGPSPRTSATATGEREKGTPNGDEGSGVDLDSAVGRRRFLRDAKALARESEAARAEADSEATGEDGQQASTGGRRKAVNTAVTAAKAKAAETASQFREKPLQTTKSGAGAVAKGAAYAAGGVALAATGGTGLLALGGGVAYAGRRYRAHQEKNQALMRDPATRRMVEDHYQAQREAAALQAMDGAVADAPARDETGQTERTDETRTIAAAAPTHPEAQGNGHEFVMPPSQTQRPSSPRPASALAAASAAAPAQQAAAREAVTSGAQAPVRPARARNRVAEGEVDYRYASADELDLLTLETSRRVREEQDRAAGPQP